MAGNFSVEVGGWVPANETAQETLDMADWDIDTIKRMIGEGMCINKQDALDESPDVVYRKICLVITWDVEDFKNKKDSKAASRGKKNDSKT